MKDYNLDIRDYSPDQTYKAKEIVLYNGGLYQAKNDTPKHDWLPADWISLSDIGQSYLIVDSFNKFNTQKAGSSCVYFDSYGFKYATYNNNVWTDISTNFKNLMVVVTGSIADSFSDGVVTWKSIKKKELILFDNVGSIVDTIDIDWADSIKKLNGVEVNQHGNVELKYADTLNEQDGFLRSTAQHNLRYNNGRIELIDINIAQYEFDIIVDDIKNAPFVGEAGKTLLDLSTGLIYHSEHRDRYPVNYSELKNHFDQYGDLKRRITQFEINMMIKQPEHPDGTILSSDIGSKIPMLYLTHDYESGDCQNLDNWEESFWFIYDFMSDANYKPRYVGAYGDSTSGATKWFYHCEDKDFCHWETFLIIPEHPLYPICLQDIKNDLFNDEQLAMDWRSYINAAFRFYVEGYFWFKNPSSEQITFTPDVLIYGGNNTLATYGLDNKFHSIMTDAADDSVWVTDTYHNISSVPIDTGDLVEADIIGPNWKFDDDQEIIITGSIKRSDGFEIFVHERQNNIIIPEFNLGIYLWDDDGKPKIDYHHFILDTNMLDYYDEPYLMQALPNRDLATPIIMANFHKPQFVQPPYINYTIDDNTEPSFNITVWNTYWGVPLIDALHNEYEDDAGQKWSCDHNIKIEEIVLEDQWHKNDKGYKPLEFDVTPLPAQYDLSQKTVDKSESRGLFTKHGTINVVIPEEIRNKPAHFVITAEINNTTYNPSYTETICDTVTYIPAEYYRPEPTTEFPSVMLSTDLDDDPATDKLYTAIKGLKFSQEMGITKSAFYIAYKKGSKWWPVGDYDGEIELKIWGGDLPEIYHQILQPTERVPGQLYTYSWMKVLPKSENTYWYQIVCHDTDKYIGFEWHDHFLVVDKETVSIRMNGICTTWYRYPTIRLEIMTSNIWGHPFDDMDVKVSVKPFWGYTDWTEYHLKTGPANNPYPVDPGCINTDIHLDPGKDILKFGLYHIKAEIMEDNEFYYSVATQVVNIGFPTATNDMYFKDIAKQGCFLTAGERVKIHTPRVPQIGIKPYMDIGKLIGHDDIYDVEDWNCPTVIADSDGNEIKNWLQAIYDPSDINKTNPLGYTLAGETIFVNPPLSAVSLDLLLQQTYKSAIPPWGWLPRDIDVQPQHGPESEYYPELYNFTVISPDTNKFIKVKKVFDPLNIRSKHLPIPTLDGPLNLLIIEFLGNRYIAPQQAIVPIVQEPSLFTLLTVSPMDFVVTPADNNTIIFDISLQHWDRTPYPNQEILITAGFQKDDDDYTGIQEKITVDSNGRYQYVCNLWQKFNNLNKVKDQEFGNIFFKFNFMGHVVDAQNNPLPMDQTKLPSAKFIEGIYYRHDHTGSIPTRITGNPSALSFSPQELCDIGFGTHYSFDILMEYFDSSSNTWKPLANKELEYTMSNFSNGVMQAKGGMRVKIKTDEYGYYTWQLGYINEGGFSVDAKVINIRNNIDEGYLSFVFEGDSTYNYCITTTQIHGCAGRFSKSHDCLQYVSSIIGAFTGFALGTLSAFLGGWTTQLQWQKNEAAFREWTANRNVQLMSLTADQVGPIPTKRGATVMEQYADHDIDAVFVNDRFVEFLRSQWSIRANLRGCQSAEIPPEMFVTNEDGSQQLICGLSAARFRELAPRIMADARFVRPSPQPMFKDVTAPTHTGDSVEAVTTGAPVQLDVAKPTAPKPVTGGVEQRIFQELFPTPISGAPKLSSAFQTSAEPLLVKLGIEKQAAIPIEPIPTYPTETGSPGPAVVEVPAVKTSRYNLVICDPRTGEPIYAVSLIHNSDQADYAKATFLNTKAKMEAAVIQWMRSPKGAEALSKMFLTGGKTYPVAAFTRFDADNTDESMIWCIRACAYRYFKGMKVGPLTPASDRVQAEIYEEMRNVGYVFRTIDLRPGVTGRQGPTGLQMIQNYIRNILDNNLSGCLPNQGNPRLWRGLGNPNWEDWDPSWKP